MLKGPIEAFKYLLSSVEKSTLNLPSSTANLDIVFFATTNEKHSDAFKTIPDFASFKSRIELVTAPYLLKTSQEVNIYQNDIERSALKKPVCPTPQAFMFVGRDDKTEATHPEAYESKYRSLSLASTQGRKLLYEQESLSEMFKSQEEAQLKELRKQIRRSLKTSSLMKGDSELHHGKFVRSFTEQPRIRSIQPLRR